MTTIYVPRLIESAEQAEALADGTVAISEEFAPGAFVKDGGSWMGTHAPGAFTNESTVGLEALVPIEAEEEHGIVQDDEGTVDIARDREQADLWAEDYTVSRRLVTPWEAA
jgi:hypothetical protein